MSRRVMLPLALVALVAIAACSQREGQALTVAEVGQPAPAFSATTLAGDSTSLAALRGQVVLLNIWATWCTPCRAEIPELEALHQQYADSGLRVVGVSIDAGGEDAKVRAFAQELGMTYTIWRDPTNEITARFAAIGVPASYLVGRDGTLLWQHVGPISATDAALVAALRQAGV